MTPRDWQRFLAEGEGKELAIAQLSNELAARMGASSDFVYIHHDYVRKAAEDHGITPDRFYQLFETVDFGWALADRGTDIVFMMRDPEDRDDHWFKVVLKRCTEKRRIYVKTFYWLRDRDARMQIRKRAVIRSRNE